MTLFNQLLLFICACLLVACGSDTNQIKESNSSLSAPPKHPLGENPEACEVQNSMGEINWPALEKEYCHKLSDFNLFNSLSTASIVPKYPGMQYELNSALFTDHARKYRYIYTPNNSKIDYSELDTFNFPLGTTLVKIFSLPNDTSTDDENLIEIRLLIKRDNGWTTLVYKWHEEYSDGFFTVAGGIIESTVSHNGVANLFDYRIPTFGQCATCHQNNEGEARITPIGLKARHLNKEIMFNNVKINQLTLWDNLGILNNLPSDLSSIDTAPNWKDTSKNLQDRAKAYLDINCAHCHTEGGSGALSGLRMEYWRKTIDYSHGVCNESQGWRVGGYDIWPGRGDISHIPLRITLTAAKDRMPPIGRSLVDEEAAQLISDWIDTLPYQTCSGV